MSESDHIADKEVAKTLGRLPRKYFRCTNKTCDAIMPNPFRWEYGTHTEFACPYCKQDAKEIDTILAQELMKERSKKTDLNNLIS